MISSTFGFRVVIFSIPEHLPAPVLCGILCIGSEESLKSMFALQLDPEGFKAAAGASNQVSGDFGISGGAVLGLEIIMT